MPQRPPIATLLAALAFFSLLLCHHPAFADESDCQVWLISTRCAPPCGRLDTSLARITYQRLDADRRWVSADADAFYAADDPAVPTTFYVHGNRNNLKDAVHSGWQLYCQIKREACGRPFRYVIFAWPADIIPGMLRDVRQKAVYADAQCYYLAKVLDRIDPDVSTGLVGFSYGARVITGALHMLAGGSLKGRALAEPTAADRVPYRAVLLAPAMDADSLVPGRRNGLALTQVERVLITVNHCDPILKLYPLVDKCNCAEAMGYTGPAGLSRLGPARELIELVDVSCTVDGRHGWRFYFGDPSLRRRTARFPFIEQ